jgi:hypothetical protein
VTGWKIVAATVPKTQWEECLVMMKWRYMEGINNAWLWNFKEHSGLKVRIWEPLAYIGIY